MTRKTHEVVSLKYKLNVSFVIGSYFFVVFDIIFNYNSCQMIDHIV